MTHPPPTPAQIRARRRNGRRMSARAKVGDKAAFVDDKPVNPGAWTQAMRKEGR